MHATTKYLIDVEITSIVDQRGRARDRRSTVQGRIQAEKRRRRVLGFSHEGALLSLQLAAQPSVLVQSSRCR